MYKFEPKILYSNYCYYKQYYFLFCSNELEMTNSENSLKTNNLTLFTAVDNNYTVHSDSNKDITDMLNHTLTQDVSSSYSKWLSDCRIISESLLQLQETIGQGIVNSYT